MPLDADKLGNLDPKLAWALIALAFATTFLLPLLLAKLNKGSKPSDSNPPPPSQPAPPPTTASQAKLDVSSELLKDVVKDLRDEAKQSRTENAQLRARIDELEQRIYEERERAQEERRQAEQRAMDNRRQLERQLEAANSEIASLRAQINILIARG